MSSDDPKDEKKAADAGDELRAAFSHFRNAAQIFFERAAQDPALKSVAKDTEKAVQKFSEAADPIARQIVEQVTKVASQVTDSVQDAVNKRKKPKSPEGE